MPGVVGAVGAVGTVGAVGGWSIGAVSPAGAGTIGWRCGETTLVLFLLLVIVAITVS